MHYSKEFDDQFRYDKKDLGVVCSKEGTIFKVWCPLADRVELHLYFDGLDTQEYAVYDMVPGEKGTWSWRSGESLHGIYYDYTVTRAGKIIRTADPYATACGVNGIRSMVVDLTKTDPEGFADDKAPDKQSENIIYELHIKDFSWDPDSGVPEEYRGKYKAFTVRETDEAFSARETDKAFSAGETDKPFSAGETEQGYPTCMEYLKKLGITHVHLLPMYDFGWLDEAGDDKQFNWGYDPVNYNVPEGSFATNAFDGTVRIRECKEMVQALHQAGIRVIMDVVYNHTYEPDSWLERMVPGYYNRRWGDGSLANGSGCGSDIACGRAMVDNYIADSVMYWAKEYHIDGFRFDLMGLLTVELMNRIRRELDEAFGAGEKLLYGEPWRAADSPMEEGTHGALKSNVQLLDEGVAIFSDDTRDVIKGHVFYEEVPGFVNGGQGLEKRLLGAVTGWCDDGRAADFQPKSCAQIINYVSAHDNFTLWDKLVLSIRGGYGVNNEYRQDVVPSAESYVYMQKHEDVLEANKLAAFIYFTCQGHLFFQAGEEFGRTKLGDGNSYRSAPEINMLRWRQTLEFADLLAYYKGLISLRKKLPGLCDKSASAAKRITQKTVWQEKVVSFCVDNTSADNASADDLPAHNGYGDNASADDLPAHNGFADNTSVDSTSQETSDKWTRLFIVYNGSSQEAAVPLPEGEWVVLADKFSTDFQKKVMLNEAGELIVEACCGMMLGKT